MTDATGRDYPGILRFVEGFASAREDESGDREALAKAVADAFGGEYYYTGGNIWLTVVPVLSGIVVVGDGGVDYYPTRQAVRAASDAVAVYETVLQYTDPADGAEFQWGRSSC